MEICEGQLNELTMGLDTQCGELPSKPGDPQDKLDHFCYDTAL